MLRKPGHLVSVLVVTLGMMVCATLLLPELSVVADAHAQADPQVVAVYDLSSVPGSSCTIKLTVNPGKSTQHVKYQHACGPGAVILTREMPLSHARARHLAYLMIPASQASVQTLIAKTRATAFHATSTPLVQCGAVCRTGCGQYIKAEMYWNADLPDPPGTILMYSFVNYGRDSGPPIDCQDWLNFGQTGMENEGSIHPPGWLYNDYLSHHDQLQCRLLPFYTLETFTNWFSDPPGHNFQWTVDDKPGNSGCPWGYSDDSWSIGPLN